MVHVVTPQPRSRFFTPQEGMTRILRKASLVPDQAHRVQHRAAVFVEQDVLAYRPAYNLQHRFAGLQRAVV